MRQTKESFWWAFLSTMSLFNIEWIDGKREPQCASDPNFPNGIDIDISNGARDVCQTDLPYPADRCGHFLVTCLKCHQKIAITTAGRIDDPRSLKLACQYGKSLLPKKK